VQLRWIIDRQFDQFSNSQRKEIRSRLCSLVCLVYRWLYCCLICARPVDHQHWRKLFNSGLVNSRVKRKWPPFWLCIKLWSLFSNALSVSGTSNAIFGTSKCPVILWMMLSSNTWHPRMRLLSGKLWEMPSTNFVLLSGKCGWSAHFHLALKGRHSLSTQLFKSYCSIACVGFNTLDCGSLADFVLI
jgi:hypothetical protein